MQREKIEPITTEGPEGARFAARIVPLGFFLVLLFGAHRVLETVLAPEEYIPGVPAYHDYDPAAFQNAISPGELAAKQDRILSFGSRLMGQPGFHATADYIREVYRDAGLEIFEQDNLTVAPITKRRDVYLVGAGEETLLTNVELFPFLPNHLQPVVTPEGGIEGELVLMTEEVINMRHDFEDCIALIEAADGQAHPDYLFDWSRYAQLGVKAVVVAHRDGLEQIAWDRVAAPTGGMVSGIPVNFVRLAASEQIFRHQGERIRLDVQVQFEKVPNTTIVGILRAGEHGRDSGNDEALVLLTNYDAASILPDSAPGALQAVSLATQLCLVEAMAPYRDSLVRDVVFVAFGAQFMARDGDNNLMKLLEENVLRARREPVRDFLGISRGNEEHAGGRAGGEEHLARLRTWERRRQDNIATLKQVHEILGLFEREGFLSEWVPTAEAIGTLNRETADFLTDQVRYVLDTIVFDLYEPMAQARLTFLERGEGDQDSDAFQDYLEVRREYDLAVTAASFSPMNLLRSEDFGQAYARNNDLASLVRERLEALEEYHLHQDRHLSQSIDVLRALLAYRKLIVFESKLVPAATGDSRAESLSFWDGDWGVKTNMREMESLLASSRQRLAAIHPSITDRGAMDIPELARWHSGDVTRHTDPVTHLSATQWTQFGYHMYAFVSFGRAEAYAHYYDPVELPFMRDMESLRYSTAVFGEMLLAAAHGNGRFAPIQVGWLKKTFGGRVLAGGLGQSMVPNYPVQGAVMAARPFFGHEYSYPGFYQHPLIMTNPYGEYNLINTPSDFWVNNYIWAYGYSPVAALHDARGFITWVKDEGDTAQRLYKSVNLNWFDAKVDDVTLVLFRAAPVAFLDVTNPQRMLDFSGIRFFESRGISRLEKYCHFRVMPGRGMGVSYVEPEETVYVGLESGTPQNDLARVIRAFLLNVPADWREILAGAGTDREIHGPGYRGASAGILQDIPLQMARSLASLNHYRIELQDRHQMVDEQTLDYHQKALEFLEAAEDPYQPKLASIRHARDSATYSMLNHPVLRNSLTEAVLGILYYLALLVPFVFFFEKLIFCHSDVRKQLAAQAVIFLTVFFALRFLHPAFDMIRSSLMILLGFVVILISGSMTLLFSEKFKENLEDLSKRRGKVTAAGGNRVGIIGSAFMLGLNNMHRRKMRTALTCGTLCLMTFAMISFTSVRTDIVSEQVAIGRAPYQGVLLKKEYFQRFSDAEVFAIRSKYSHAFQVCPRRMSLGTQSWIDRRGYNPELEIVYTRGETTRSRRFNSIIQFTHQDPLQQQIEVIAGSEWFTGEDERGAPGVPPPIMIPDAMAEALGVPFEDVDAGEVTTQVNGRTFRVSGIFTAASLASVRDLDNRDILPYDIENMSRIHVLEDGEVLADESAPRIPPERIALAPLRDLGIRIPNEKPDSNSSIALNIPEEDTRHARAAVEMLLEQTERPAYYGLAGISYLGQRTRRAATSGMIDLVIPLLIVALTVLNTMKGSVYERRSEIAVYNAVGIAPRYVFFMFMAEALVYFVVGSVLGYVLSQGVGKLLIGLNLTGGMNMTFTSITTIYASLAVGATVLASTWFPARTAMEIARPAEEAGWKMPDPVDEALVFDLPFTFNWRDRMAVLAFCARFLEDHGEGGSGSFYCLPPEPHLSSNTEGDPSEIPGLVTTVWLKPYDLGVSQRAIITMPRDPDTGEFKAWVRLEVLSGSRDAWVRLNRRFVAELRRQFLHWRAVSEQDRQEMFEEARQMFEQELQAEAIR